MRIIFTTDNVGRGGKERQMFIVASFLMKKGWGDVFILSMSIGRQSYISEYNFPAEKIRIIGKDNIITSMKSYNKQIKLIKPDLIFSWDTKTSLYSLLAKWTYYRGIFINGCIRHGIRLIQLSHLFRSVICWLSPYVVANSLVGLKVNNLKTNDRRFVLYNGIENKFFLKKDRENLIAKKKLLLSINQIDNNRPVFISVANFVPYKDYFTVLTSLKEVKKIYEFYYIILGDGPDRNIISGMIKDFGLDKNIFLMGTVDNVQDYLSVSNYMIHSSRGEGISNAILEGMFSGLPIIATNVGGVSETIYEKSSVLFEYQDVDELTSILLNLNNYFNSFNCESRSYKAHLNKFTVKTMLDNFEGILDKVCQYENKYKMDVW